MFAVIYSFSIDIAKRSDFLESWREMTLLIRKYEGGLGSRLHRLSETEYLAYAQWPDRETWENSGDKLPDEALLVRAKMRSACTEIQTLHELVVVDDLLI